MGILARNIRVDMTSDADVEGRDRRQAHRRREAAAQGQRLRRTAPARPSWSARDTVEVVDANDGKATTIEAANIVLATGSRPIEIPASRSTGSAWSTRPARWRSPRCPKRLVVIGGGYIGLELGHALRASSAPRSRVVEALAGVLPGNGSGLVQVVARKLKKLGVEVMTGAKAKSWAEKGDRAVVTVETGRDEGNEATIDADKILVAVGRRPNCEGLGLEELGRQDRRAASSRSTARMRTNVAGIYAIGDVAGQPMLAHKASSEAEVVAEVIAGHRGRDATCAASRRSSSPIPRSRRPASPPTEAEQAGPQGQGRQVPVRRARTRASRTDTEGFVKVIADADTERGPGRPHGRQRRHRPHRRGRAGHRDGRAGRRPGADDPRPPDAARGDDGGRQGRLGEAIHIVNR